MTAPATPKLISEDLIVGVVGAGNMGAGIAQKYATEGFTVLVADRNQHYANMGKERVQRTLREGVERGVFTQEKADDILDRMSFIGEMAGLKAADLVVEAVFEDMEVKKRLFKELDELCPPSTILATNTSSFFVEDFAGVCTHPERLLGLHYFFHPAKNKLVEVIPGTKTSEAVRARAWAIQELSGKLPVHCKDRPGFIVNRFFVPWLNESMRIVEEGIARIPSVEAAAKKSFGVGMGPFELMNVTGVPITLHAATTLRDQLGDFYRPASTIHMLVDQGEQWQLSGDVDEERLDDIADRLWATVAMIACQLVFEEGVCSMEDCDLAARVGLRWPKGPFEVINEMGTQRVLKLVEDLVAHHDKTGITVPETLKAHGAENKPFDLRIVGHRVDADGVGFITINRPDAMNALSELVVDQLESAFDALHADPAVKGIVIEGRGKAFVAGADVRWFVDQIKAENVDGIVAYAAHGQDVFRKIDQSTKPVVCKLHGLSLGGGSELALACDYIVASPGGSMGFPETGIGIYPGLGGTQRSARRVGVPLARWLVLTGQAVDARTGLALGLVDELVQSSELDAAVRRHALSGKVRPEAAPPTAAPAQFTAVAQVFQASLDELLFGSVALPEGDERAAMEKSLKRLGHKAPLALRAADTLLLAAGGNTLADGLKAETDGLHAIFSTADALEGLSKAGRGRPEFKGA